MPDRIARLINKPLTANGPITRPAGAHDKNDLHRRFLRDWIARTETVRGRTLDDVWRIREECIAALGGGAYSTPAC
jgi:hypothetical protein